MGGIPEVACSFSNKPLRGSHVAAIDEGDRSDEERGAGPHRRLTNGSAMGWTPLHAAGFWMLGWLWTIVSVVFAGGARAELDWFPVRVEEEA